MSIKSFERILNSDPSQILEAKEISENLTTNSDDNNSNNSSNSTLYSRSSILKRKTIEKTSSYTNDLSKKERLRVTFKTPLKTEHNVENWKEYNCDMSVYNEDLCTCTIY